MRPASRTFGTFRYLAIGAICLSAAAVSVSARAEDNLLINGDLARGSGSQLDLWRTEAWINSPDAFHYDWIHPESGGPHQAEIENLKPNDARWMQSISLGPGWYHASAEARTEAVGAYEMGANISVPEDGIVSSDIRGTSGWQTVGFYLKVGPRGADVDIALRVGGFGSLNTGRAFFRDVKLVKIAAPQPGTQHAYDLDTIRMAAAPEPIGSPITLVLMFLVLSGGAVWGWILFGTEHQKPEMAASRPRRRAHRG
ncbi:MAG TPA: hypothetical protein VIX12_04120 [Candidatus Binataceae bacterium]